MPGRLILSNGRYVGEYRPATCAYCQAETWCETRSDRTLQCRACKVERFFERVLYPPLGYELQGWQRRILRALYGSVDSQTSLRQYRRSYISVAKQNGKSFLLGGFPIYHLLMENKPQPEDYGVASARDQAGIVYSRGALGGQQRGASEALEGSGEHETSDAAKHGGSTGVARLPP